MSSILKALKKLEDENNARTPDSLKINAEILRGSESQRFSSTGIILAALLLFLGGGGIMYLFMKPGRNKIVSASVPVAVERIVPAATVSASPSSSAPQTMPVASPRQSPVVQTQIVEKSKHSPSTAPSTVITTMKNKPLTVLNNGKPLLVPTTASQQELPEPPIVTARPVIRVNGIAFQDGSDSVAVINGVPVSRGTSIEGVKIEEIQRDRVQFSYGGEKFEIFLGKSNQ